MEEILMPPVTFDQLLDAVEKLPLDAQAELVEVVRLRLAEQGRQRVVHEVQESRQEYRNGQCKQGNVDDVMREIES